MWDANGKEYIDATSGGTWTVNVGYGRTEIADAVHRQISKMQYFSLQVTSRVILCMEIVDDGY